MSDFSIYDGLMPKIQALIQPPDYGTKEKTVPDKFPFYKKRGRRHNHDYCDACKEKGNLLCCEICPTSFHLLCCDPPLIGDKIPRGPWHCRACTFIRKNESNDSNELVPEVSKSSLNSVDKFEIRLRESGEESDETCYSSPPSTECFAINIHRCQERIKDDTICGNELTGDEKSMYELQVKLKSDIDDENSSKKESRNSNMRTEKEKLIAREEVRVSVPKCDLVLNEHGGAEYNEILDSRLSSMKKTLPVSENTGASSSSSTTLTDIFNEVAQKVKQANPKQFSLPMEYLIDIDANIFMDNKDLDVPNDFDGNDLLKLPPRRCFYCNGICLSGEMISCDFCPANFHFNCLDPPMCSLPDTKWMCPLHPHHILDKIMKNRSSISELSSWWKKLSVPVDDENVKSEFINKVKTAKEKNTPKPDIRRISKIPHIIRYHYENLLTRIPTVDEFFNSGESILGKKLTLSTNNCTDEAEQFSFDEHMKPLRNSEDVQMEEDATDERDNGNISARPRYDKFIEISDDPTPCNCTSKRKNNSVMRKSTNEDLSVWDTKSKMFKYQSSGIYDYDSSALDVRKNGKMDRHKEATVSRGKLFQTNTSDMGLDSPWKHIRQIIVSDIRKNFITENDRLDRDPCLEEHLLNQKMYSIIRDFPPSLRPCTLPYPFFPPPREQIYQLLPEEPEAKVQAVLCPLSHRAPLIFMYENVLNVGTAFTNDVCLRNFGHCNLVSDSHAVIYYDKLTKMYELLNYSEFCTIVDGITYTCDISRSGLANDRNISNGDDSHVSNVRKESDDEDLEMDINDNKEVARSDSETKGSVIAAVETRNTYKKLIQDIDKLVMKTQKEMSVIADEDLNEISKILKSNKEASDHQREEPSTEKEKVKQKPASVYGSKSKGQKMVAKKCYDYENTKSRSVSPVTGNGNGNEMEKANELAQTAKNKNSTEKFHEKSRLQENAQSLLPKDENESLAVRRSRRRVKRKILGYRTQRIKRKKMQQRKMKKVYEDELLTKSNEDFQSINDLKLLKKQKLCQCQLLDMKLPLGRDSSWEKAATLHHGSYIRFGCLEFVFCIVNYPVKFEERSYARRSVRKSTFSDESDRIERSVRSPPPTEKTSGSRNDDLSIKLISILNVLSKTRSRDSSTSEPPSSSPPRNSSRSSSPASSEPAFPVDTGLERITNNPVIKINYDDLC